MRKKKRTVVVDCGHGGGDPGTVGCFGLKEKDITLGVGLKVARFLRSMGFKVLLTRSKDTTVSLERRIEKVNRCCCADIVISVHANSSPRHATGVETFCPKTALFYRHVSMLCARHQAVADKCDKRRCDACQILAGAVQKHVVAGARKKNKHALDRGVKYAVSRLLLGTEIPGALVEIGFLSSEHEAALLRDPSYQVTIARSICGGIKAYFESVHG